MRVSDLVSMASWYLKMGIVAVPFIMFCIFAGYFVVYKKLQKGQKEITWKGFIWLGILVCYLCVVLGATFFSRGSFWSNSRIQPLFYSYKDAWINFSNATWRNIILNFCMFIPFGFWLPLGIKRLRRFWRTYLAGFVFSLLIEYMQLFLRRGIFELDDIMGNTVGAMIGYGLFAAGLFFVNGIGSRKEREHLGAVSVVLLQAPLIVTVAAFAMIFRKYDRQELGNNPYRCIEACDSTRIRVTGENTFRTEEAALETYAVSTLTVDAAREKGERIFEALGTAADESRTNVYDETIIMYSQEGDYCVWIDYRGGTVEFTNYDVLYPEGNARPEPVSGADEAEIRKAVSDIGFEVPEETDFMERESGVYQFEAAMSETDEGIVNGTFTCRWYGEEKGVGKISDYLITGTPYKAYTAISEQEAYEKLVNGEFACGSDGELEIQVASCSLAYVLDSKGYYQPNYVFECTVNGKESQIMIPVLKN